MFRKYYLPVLYTSVFWQVFLSVYSLYFFIETVQRCKRANIQTCYCVFFKPSSSSGKLCDVPLCSDRVQDCEIKVQSVARVWNLDLCLFYFVTDLVCLV